MLTKMDIAALKHADCLCVHITKDGTIVRAIKRNPRTEKQPFATDLEHVIPATVGLEGLRGRDELAAGRVTAFASVNLYPTQKHTACLILQTLRAGDELTFSFWPDAGTNGYVAAAGLHADCLYLHVRRNGKQIANWHLADSICPDNSARMVRGVPNSASYEKDAAEARRVA